MILTFFVKRLKKKLLFYVLLFFQFCLENIKIIIKK